MSSTELKESSIEKTAVMVAPEQAEHLEKLFEVAKVLASPVRLAIIGLLAAQMKQTFLVEELAEQLKLAPAQLERDLRQLSESGFILIEEWHSPKAGREPVPLKITFNPEYLKLMPQLITTLHQLSSQLHPAEQAPALDDRANTIKRFIKDGRLTGFPAQFKRQLYILEEVAKVFEPNVKYTEREVDAILKNIYEYDHCTLRRYLVDCRFLSRAEGLYWKI